MNYDLISRDHKAVGRRPFDKMATLLAYLGPPEHKPVADTHWSSLNLTSSKFEEFMTRLVYYWPVTCLLMDFFLKLPFFHMPCTSKSRFKSLLSLIFCFHSVVEVFYLIAKCIMDVVIISLFSDMTFIELN